MEKIWVLLVYIFGFKLASAVAVGKVSQVKLFILKVVFVVTVNVKWQLDNYKNDVSSSIIISFE